MQMILNRGIYNEELNIIRKRIVFYERLSKLVSKKRALEKMITKLSHGHPLNKLRIN